MKKFGKFLGIVFVVVLIAGAFVNSEIGSYILNKVGIPVGRQLPSVPDELKENIFLDSREMGGCEKMSGDVLVMFIFVDDGISSWTSEKITESMASYETQLDALESAAEGYGVTLEFKAKHTTAKVDEILDRNDYKEWADDVFADAGLKSTAYFDDELREDFSVSQATAFVCFNKGGRAFAVSKNIEDASEYGVLFDDSSAFAHELCHIFGAADFYYPDSVVEAAEKYIADSVMKDPSNVTLDPFSAYLVGWTDELSEDSISFLEETNYISQELYNLQHEQETYTGLVTDREMDGGTYTGYLVDGFRHGEGTFAFDSGDVYTGNWYHGSRVGQGTYTWADGSTFTGTWSENSEMLEGTYTWTTGNVYTGGFLNGAFNGYARFVWSNGDVYEGNFANGLRNGQGTLTWAEGGSYSGSWVDGVRSGEGTYTWANGDVYTGGFLDGKLHGQGTLTYASGRTVSGSWVNGEYAG